MRRLHWQVLGVAGASLSLRLVASSSSAACASFSTEKGVGCEACLNNTCAWSEGQCLSQCDPKVAGPCFSLKDLDETKSTFEICSRARNVISAKDASICEGNQDCKTCVNTISNDGTKLCQWFDGDILEPFCDAGECINGICGSTTCSEENVGKVLENFDKILEGRGLESNATASAQPGEGLDDTACQEIAECVSCLGNPTCSWNNGTCSIGMDSPSPTSNTTIAEVCSREDDDLAALFEEVADAIEDAKDEDSAEGEAVEVDATGEEEEDPETVETDGASNATPEAGTVVASATGTDVSTSAGTSPFGCSVAKAAWLLLQVLFSAS